MKQQDRIFLFFLGMFCVSLIHGYIQSFFSTWQQNFFSINTLSLILDLFMIIINIKDKK
jgi:hypothetical protein